MPKCIDCKHLARDNHPDAAECLQSGLHAKVSRDSLPGRCGPSGRYFEPSQSEVKND